jgi:hypothetical protein
VQVPFPLDPPHPPDENPIGDYRLDFTPDAAVPGHRRRLLRFDGIESAAEVRLNGVLLGTTRGSRLATLHADRHWATAGHVVSSGRACASLSPHGPSRPEPSRLTPLVPRGSTRSPPI